MSIVIHGMKMPKDGECVVVFPGGLVQKYKAGGIAFYEYQDRTEETVAVQLPPHGDLIDRSKIRFTDFEIVMCDGDFRQGLKMLAEKIENADTIIPADPEGGDGNVFASDEFRRIDGYIRAAYPLKEENQE